MNDTDTARSATSTDTAVDSFAVLSDVHYNPLHPDRLRRFEDVLRAVLEQRPAIDRVVVAGDAADYGMPWEYVALHRAVRRVGLPDERVLFSMGNHEQRMRPFRWAWSRFRRWHHLKSATYRVDTDRIGFIVLAGDLIPSDRENARYSSDRLAWLDDALSASEREGRLGVVIMHQPLPDTTDGSRAGQESRSIDDAADLRDVLMRHPHAFVFAGHSHHTPDIFAEPGMPVFVNDGAVGFDPDYDPAFCTYCLVDVTHDDVRITAWDHLGRRALWQRTFPRTLQNA